MEHTNLSLKWIHVCYFPQKKTLLHFMPDYSYYCESFFLYKDPNISTNHDEIFGFLVSMYYYITLPPLLLPYIGARYSVYSLSNKGLNDTLHISPYFIKKGNTSLLISRNGY